MVIRTFLLVIVAAAACFGQKPAPPEPAFPPHKIIGNVYYVGTLNFASYLITTPQGHIVINSGFAKLVPVIKANIEKLGFKFKDVKFLLTSESHADHISGCDDFMKETGAFLYVMNGDEKVVSQGGEGDFAYDMMWEPCMVKRILKDSDRVLLPNLTMTARHTPGHTPGATTWLLKVTEGGKTYDVVFAASPNVNPTYRLINNDKYPQIADDYRRTFSVLKSLKCDVFLGAHGADHKMQQKYARIGKGANPFIDPEGYKAYVAEREATFLAKLAEQQRQK